MLDNQCNCSKTKKLDENPKTTCDGFAEIFKTKPDLSILKSIITVYTWSKIKALYYQDSVSCFECTYSDFHHMLNLQLSSTCYRKLGVHTWNIISTWNVISFYLYRIPNNSFKMKGHFTKCGFSTINIIFSYYWSLIRAC